MNADQLRKAEGRLKNALGAGSCQHLNSTRTEDTNDIGTMIIYNCPDCGFTAYVHPEQEKLWDSMQA